MPDLMAALGRRRISAHPRRPGAIPGSLPGPARWEQKHSTYGTVGPTYR